MALRGVNGKSVSAKVDYLILLVILIIFSGCDPYGIDTDRSDRSTYDPSFLGNSDDPDESATENSAQDLLDLAAERSRRDLPLGACFDFPHMFEGWHPGEEIRFDAGCSTGPVTGYYWKMRYGMQAEQDGPVHSYAFERAGRYDVVLTVESEDGTIDSCTRSVTIQPASMVEDLTPVDWNYHPKDIVLLDSKIYMAAGKEGLVVFDVENPFEPRQISRLYLGGEAVRIAADGNFAAVACPDAGLKIVDISDPTSPAIAGTYREGDFEVRFVEMRGEYVYCGLGTEYGDHPHPSEPEGSAPPSPPPPIPGKAVILNIRNPGSPLVVASYDTEEKSVTCMTLTDDYFYFIEGRWLRAINISNPATPSILYDMRLGSIFRGPIEDLEVRNGIGYATVKLASYVKVFNMSAPDDLRALCEVSIPGCSDITMCREHMMASTSNGMKILRISPDGIPEIITGINMHPVIAFQADDEFIYIACQGGLDIVDYWVPGEPQIIGSAVTFGNPHNLIQNGEILYVPDSTVGWHILDVSDPANAEVVNRVDIPAVMDYRRAGNTIMYIDEDSFLVCNIADPENPRIIGSLELNQNCRGIDFKNHLAYVVSESGKLIIIDASDPSQPVEIGRLDSDMKFHDIEIIEGYAYVAADDAGLIIVDVTLPGMPKIAGTVPTDRKITRIFTYEGYLVMSSIERNLAIAEIPVPGAVRIINQLPNFMSMSGYSVVGDTVYVVENTPYQGGENRIRVIDMADPLNPQLTGPIMLPFNADSIIVDNGYAYLTLGYYGGFRIVKLPD